MSSDTNDLTGFVTVESQAKDKRQCQAEGRKQGESWDQQPNLIKTQITCVSKHAEQDDVTCESDFIKNNTLQKAKQLGLAWQGKTQRELCRIVNVEEQRRCLFTEHKCPDGMEPDWPKHPTCCRPKSKGPQTVATEKRAEQNITVFVTRLAKLSGVWKMISPQEQEAMVNETKFDGATKKKMAANIEEWNKRVEEFDKTMPDMGAVEKRFVSSIVAQLKDELGSNFAALLAETRQKTEPQATTKTAVPSRDEYEVFAWTASASWEAIKYVGSFLPSMAKVSFNLIKWVMEHPSTAMFLTQLALQLKKRLCREMSLAFGYKSGAVEGNILDFFKGRARTFYDENWEAVALATLHRWVEGYGFERMASKLGEGLRSCFTSATVWLGVATVLTGPAGMVAGGVGWLITAGIAEAFATSVHDTLLATTTGLLMQKTTKDFLELLTSSCLQDQPKTVERTR